MVVYVMNTPATKTQVTQTTTVAVNTGGEASTTFRGLTKFLGRNGKLCRKVKVRLDGEGEVKLRN